MPISVSVDRNCRCKTISRSRAQFSLSFRCSARQTIIYKCLRVRVIPFQMESPIAMVPVLNLPNVQPGKISLPEAAAQCPQNNMAPQFLQISASSPQSSIWSRQKSAQAASTTDDSQGMMRWSDPSTLSASSLATSLRGSQPSSSKSVVVSRQDADLQPWR